MSTWQRPIAHELAGRAGAVVTAMRLRGVREGRREGTDKRTEGRENKRVK